MSRIYGTTRLLRSWDLSPYENIHNSYTPFRVSNNHDHLVSWIGEVTGKLWWDVVGWWWISKARCWWNPPLNTQSDVIWKESRVRQEDRIVEVIPRLLGSSSNPNKGKGWKGSRSEYIHPCMIVNKDSIRLFKERWCDECPNIAVQQNENQKV